MSMRTSALENSVKRSPLAEAQWLGNTGLSVRKKRQSSFLLPLTSLIDAFSIIVIYLLIGTQAGGLDMDMPKQIQLPVAESGQIIEAEMPTVRIEKGVYFINNQAVPKTQLAQKLYELKQSLADKNGVELLIQADTAMNYADLDPLLRAGSEAGIQKLKFAVIPPK
jgi:biopolymer transport protein ExbD